MQRLSLRRQAKQPTAPAPRSAPVPMDPKDLQRVAGGLPRGGGWLAIEEPQQLPRGGGWA